MYFKLILFFPIKPYVIHIVPSAHGKANNQIIEKLYEIKNILHNYRIEIITFSFDGDNAYRNSNQTFYDSFIYRMIKKKFNSYRSDTFNSNFARLFTHFKTITL